MKNSKEYSRKIQKFYHLLKSKYPKVVNVTHETVADALVYAIVSENTSESSTKAAIKRFGEHFVDLNDLRVSRTEEIAEVIGADTPVTKDTVSALTNALRVIFDEYNAVSLEALKKFGKRPAKQALEKIEGTSPFVVSYCMLTSLQGHAIPLTKQMIEYLRNNELVDAEADEHEIEGFLTKQVSAKNGYEFYSLLRCESESPKIKWKKKTTLKTKTKPKTRIKKAKK